MKQNLTRWWESIPEKGGLIGSLLGALASFRSHGPQDKPLGKASKTALFSGAGFLLGQWLEKVLFKHRTPNTEH